MKGREKKKKRKKEKKEIGYYYSLKFWTLNVIRL